MNGRMPAQPCSVEVSSQPPDWQGYLAGQPQATIYHSPQWGLVMQRAYGNQPLYLTARRAGTVVGILQLVAQKSLVFGSHLCSLPYFDASGVLAEDASATQALLEEARRLLAECRAAWIELRQLQPADAALPARTDKLTLQLALPSSPEGLWESFKPKVRNQIRKAEKAELRTAQGGRELLPRFYEVYLRTMRDLGSPPHGPRFFELTLEALGPQCRLHAVLLGEQTLAAGLTLADRRAVRVPWAGSDWRQRDLNANMLLYWAMLAEACRGGAPCFDFGRSTLDSGTYRFKKQWGADDTPLAWQFLLPPGKALPELRPDSPKYRLMVACWKRLPLPLAARLGPRIIAKLS